MDEIALIEKLRRIEALHAGATTKGERVAAERARERITARLEELRRDDPETEYKFCLRDMWRKKLFVALLRRYGIRPYRYHRQRYTTVMAQVSPRFVDEVLWPEYEELSSELVAYLADVTDRVIAEALHADSSDTAVVDGTPQKLAAT